jgi:hypothetical protein
MLPDYVPAPSTGFAVATKPRRVSLAAQASGLRLVTIAREIGQANDDRGLVGRLLREAKGLCPHGKFQAWVTDKLGMSIRTAQAIMAEKCPVLRTS